MNILGCIYWTKRLSEAWAIEWVTCKNFGFLSCFRQGWVHVTLRNKKNIGLICFMFISSSYFWLLCRTKTAWWSKNENVSNRLKQSKKYVRSDVVTQKIQCKSVFTVHLLILKMFQTDFGCTMNICPNFFCHSGQCQQHKSPMTQLFGIFFGQTLLFSLSPFLLGLPNNANAMTIVTLV